jgi:hypothetical protein
MSGVFIAGMGLPGSGKSSVFAALADLLIRDRVTTTLYREPEETEWPIAVTKRKQCGCMTALTWFRAQRVPNLYEAALDRDRGAIALVDSYYDKLIHLYFDDPGLEWLMPKEDPYRAAYKELIALDHKLLPNADCVVILTVAENRWKELVLGRGRELDREANLLERYSTQESFCRATQHFCEVGGVQLVVIENKYDSALATAIALRAHLIRAQILQ